jgi:hypothetical protein
MHKLGLELEIKNFTFFFWWALKTSLITLKVKNLFDKKNIKIIQSLWIFKNEN